MSRRQNRPSPRQSDLVGTRAVVEVGEVAHGGHCVARMPDGRVVFVRHALPGEQVELLVTEGGSDSRFLRADAVQVLDYRAGFGAKLVTDGARADDLTVVFDQDGGGAVGLHGRDPLIERAGLDPVGTAQPRGPSVDEAGQAGPGNSLHIARGGGLAVGGEDRAGERVFAVRFQRRGDGEHPLLARSAVAQAAPGARSSGVGGGGGDVDDGGPVRGQSAGLVEGDGADPAEGFEGGTSFDQDADLAGGADRRDHGHRHRDRQRTRRRSDQHDQRPLEPRDRRLRVAEGEAGEHGLLAHGAGRYAVAAAASIVVGETVVPSALGIALLGDSTRPGWAVPTLIAFAAAVSGAIVVATSSAVEATESAA